jgi:hypothetical protein
VSFSFYQIFNLPKEDRLRLGLRKVPDDHNFLLNRGLSAGEKRVKRARTGVGQNLNEAAEDMYSADMFKQLCSSMTKLSLTEE